MASVEAGTSVTTEMTFANCMLYFFRSASPREGYPSDGECLQRGVHPGQGRQLQGRRQICRQASAQEVSSSLHMYIYFIRSIADITRQIA